MDFYQIRVNERKDGPPEIFPDWTVGRSQDLMVRGRSFYAIWDEDRGSWSTDEYDVQRLVDEDLHRYNEEHGNQYVVKNLKSFRTKTWTEFRKFMLNISDNSHSLDETLVFDNMEVKKTNYSSRRLHYSLEPGDISAWDELIGVLYSAEERAKIEWAIGSVVAGESKNIQKFLVFYGPPGSGKSTVLNIVRDLFDGYSVSFDAKALGSGNGTFATEVFRSNPLVAIQHDGDLSRIDDNARLNSIIAHEEMTMNEKYKPTYTDRVNAFLFMGTNQPVRISDAKSGLIRRLIDVHPTGVKIDPDRYEYLMSQIRFEHGAIAHYCLERFNEMGKTYYNSYRPIEMMLQTDVFYNYVEYYFDIFKSQDGTTLKQAYELYKEFGAETGVEKLMPRHKFREELRNYFNTFEDRAEVEGVRVRSYYGGFKHLAQPDIYVSDPEYVITLGDFESALDRNYSDQPAQYARDNGNPSKKWASVKTKLEQLDTARLHYVKIPLNHIVVDFDLVDASGEKNLDLNLKAAAKWPPTYTELSKSGRGLHLHYIYNGDVTELASVYSEGIEVKTLLGDASLRRKLTECNTLDFATISSGIPKKEKSVLDKKQISTEKGLRELIEKNLRKEIHAGTKPSVDFIHKILDEVYNQGLSYDLRDMRSVILAFAANSTNQADAAIKTVQKMQFVGKTEMTDVNLPDDKPIVFFDCEVYPNLFVVCWKYAGDTDVVKMVNPKPEDIEPLFSLKLVGFFNRQYDNHMLWARYLGYSNEDLFNLSQDLIVNNKRSRLFGEAYNVSYTDIYDFSSKKQSLKKFQIDLGIHHMELDIPWDEPVQEKLWDLVIKYCVNDVLATEAVFYSREQDFVARQILAELSGLSVNHSTQQHTARIIFGQEKNPQSAFNYTNLSEMFPGYKFDGKESTYRGENPSEGGYVYSEPGMYENVAVLDVASMHPTSTVALNLFGPYTTRYQELIEARLAIKHRDTRAISTLLGGKLAQFAKGDDSDLEALSYALKIVINIVYGLTSARFPNAFKDNRNIDNIVAKRGALFMIDLKHAVQNEDFQVVHIKTDSIKIPDATPKIIKFIIDFGEKYGYTFEHEGTYSAFCLINDAVYIAREGDKWTAVGAQFQHPYVFKSLFSREEVDFDDLCETKAVVQGVMYLDPNEEGSETLPLIHVGRTGSFIPVTDGGYRLLRVKDDKQYAVTGTKGYKWIERDMALSRSEPYTTYVDMSYFEKLRIDAEEAIDFFGPFERFVS